MLNTHDNYLCYEYGDTIEKCKDRYSNECPRVCILWNKELGESSGIERLFTLKEIKDGESSRNKD